MKRHLATYTFCLFLVSIGLSPRLPVYSQASSSIEYEVWMTQPQAHYIDVAVTVTGVKGDSIDLVLPVWTPGSYLIREYARHVISMFAVNGQGHPLRGRKTSKNTWRIHTEGANTIRVRYRVYAFDENMRENYLDDSHAYINGASLFMYVEGLTHLPVRLKVHPAAGWNTISTGLDPLPGQQWQFQAPNYDVLADCPIEIGRQKVFPFTVEGVPHRIAIYGSENYDPERLVRDVQRIVQAAVDLMGDIPYSHYTFIVHLSPTGGGGIEHANSTSLDFPRHGFQEKRQYNHWLSLVAHEFFHLWNVKRVRPKELGPFDYTRENYTRMLWVAEGFTSYYANRILRQAGFLTDDEYIHRLANAISELQARPGRRVQSVAEASFDAWIKYYRPNENSVNTTVSYYNKGEILGALLDLELRYRTDGTRSLDDVMRRLYWEFYKKRNIGYSEEDFRLLCEQIAGTDLSDFFSQYVYGTSEIDYDRFLNHAGLKLVPTEPKHESAYLGASVRNRGGKVIVRSVLAGSPAFLAGIYPRDEIEEVDDETVNFTSYRKLLRAKKPGDELKFTLSRNGSARIVHLVLRQRPVTKFQIRKLAHPSEKQRAIYQGWAQTPIVNGQ